MVHGAFLGAHRDADCLHDHSGTPGRSACLVSERNTAHLLGRPQSLSDIMRSVHLFSFSTLDLNTSARHSPSCTLMGQKVSVKRIILFAKSYYLLQLALPLWQRLNVQP